MKINPIAITDIPFMPKMQKRANHTEVKPPFFNNKSSKSTCYGGVDTIFDFQMRSIIEVLF